MKIGSNNFGHALISKIKANSWFQHLRGIDIDFCEGLTRPLCGCVAEKCDEVDDASLFVQSQSSIQLLQSGRKCERRHELPQPQHRLLTHEQTSCYRG